MRLTEIGRIVRLQIQRESLKRGLPRARYYDPGPLLPVERLLLTRDGVAAIGPDGAEQIDVHNGRHPESKRRSENPVSIGFSTHYAAMRERFGAHLSDGIAGENILVETDRPLTLDDIGNGIVILGSDGRRIELSSISVAHPCVEFSRFALGDPRGEPLIVSEALRFLDNGVRGFYACVEADGRFEARHGDLMCLAAPA